MAGDKDCRQEIGGVFAETRNAAKNSVGYKEEYQGLAKMASHHSFRVIFVCFFLDGHSNPRVNRTAEQELAICQKQFQVLMQCMTDLETLV